jgi:polysaccharide export outer membrane protein
MKTRVLCVGAAALCLGWMLAPVAIVAQSNPAAAGQAGASLRGDYIVAASDVLNIAVEDGAELTGHFTVQADGSVVMPLVGSLAAAGLTVREFQDHLAKRLTEGFINDPHVTVTLETFKGQRLFVFGNVATPGMYPLTEGQTLIETLARVGYGTAAEAVVLRPKHATGPTLPESAGDAEVFRINLRELEKDVERGSLSRNMILRDGDTVFVPRTDPTRVFVSGHVHTPGAYSIAEGTTVIQALAFAGGATEEAAVNRLRVLRVVDGRQRTIDVKLTDVVRPGDTLIVPERFF